MAGVASHTPALNMAAIKLTRNLAAGRTAFSSAPVTLMASWVRLPDLRVPKASKTETADDFVLTQATVVSGATIHGLIPSGTAVSGIARVEVEIYEQSEYWGWTT
jgi:hypothetical protein